MPRVTKRPVWIVSVYGGEYEDAWEHARSVYTSKEMAEIAAENINRKIELDGNDPYGFDDDPVGALVRKSFLVDVKPVVPDA